MPRTSTINRDVDIDVCQQECSFVAVHFPVRERGKGSEVDWERRWVMGDGEVEEVKEEDEDEEELEEEEEGEGIPEGAAAQSISTTTTTNVANQQGCLQIAKIPNY
ncbi:hypothetical protein TWF788_001521 [Orbilia oligospora]|uniref:Uncharacterized protein n=1 Tax=Orbilia oligospora TaxID=2813651 RepID=A0A7C8KDN3_ORBOL|nr:hypothetical protein TWF788_001521 [Orbilia oligospora]